MKMCKFIAILLIVFAASAHFGLFPREAVADSYTIHEPVIIENIETTADNPLIIEGVRNLGTRRPRHPDTGSRLRCNQEQLCS